MAKSCVTGVDARRMAEPGQKAPQESAEAVFGTLEQALAKLQEDHDKTTAFTRNKLNETAKEKGAAALAGWERVRCYAVMRYFQLRIGGWDEAHPNPLGAMQASAECASTYYGKRNKRSCLQSAQHSRMGWRLHEARNHGRIRTRPAYQNEVNHIG